ncbi:MAG: NAD(P)H-dependent oxidoreductase [Gammaproteobacteria bacterium]|jgi:nitroreductase
MNFIEAMNFRHACKAFDPNKKVSFTDQNLILEFGRLSPSSFGLEPWHFLVINDLKLREKIRPACWNQAQITDSSFVVVYLACLPHQFRRDSKFMRQRVWRRSLEEQRYQMFQNLVIDYLSEQNTVEWAKRQTYIALANMMTGAASLRIDSCPMEGFHADALKITLKEQVDWSLFDPVALCAFGYRAGKQTQQTRELLDSVYTVI